MAGTSKSESTSAGRAPAQGSDAIELLLQDHEEVKAMFEKYEALSDRSIASKRRLALEICLALTKHTVIEEEIFYPAVREANRQNEDIVDEAIVEHASAKDLIAQIIGMEPTEDLYDAKIKVLSEQIEHHVGEEENEMFPKARNGKLDLESLGQEMMARKAEVQLPQTQ
ncbi:MAG: hemerythrin domain-containing protein [Massilia sp.]